MNISCNWLKDYIDIDFDADTLAEKLTKLGLEVEGKYAYSNAPELAEGLLIGQVMHEKPHPNADRLRLTQVNVGEPELLHIVCGAPNVAEGQKVVVATVGTSLAPIEGEPFVIKKSKIRGEASEGMICAEDEIGLGTNHAGVMVLPGDAPIGMPFRNYIRTYRDEVLEIGLTPNRVDAASHIGVARDLAALTGKKVIYPNIGLEIKNTEKPSIQIDIQDKNACPRYSGLIIRGIKVQDSPDWLQNKLRAVGLKPINNIVDVTNFVMYELGQPIHAFDLAEIKGSKIIIRRADGGSKFITLDKIERELNGRELMICNAEEPMAIAGVFGGLHSGITENTKDIFIESAYFNPSIVRQTSRRHGIFTDASFRFERGADPNVTVFAAMRVASLITEVSGGKIEDHLYDEYQNPLEPVKLQLAFDYLDKIAGASIPYEVVKNILQGLEIKILEENPAALTIEIPSFKSDVCRPVDVVEEILRIYSYDRIPFSKQIRSVMQVDKTYQREQARKRISSYLADNGFFEAYMLSFVNEEANSVYADREPVKVLNPLSADLAQLRNNMLIPGLKMLQHNINRQQPDNRFFSWGMQHHMKNDNFKENYRLSLWVTGIERTENWHDKAKNADFYYLKGIVENVLSLGGISDYQFESLEDEHFLFAGGYFSGQKEIVRLGRVEDDLLKKADISQEVFFADFNADALLKDRKQLQYQPVSRYPRMERDLALQVPAALTYADIRNLIQQTERRLIRKVRIFDVYQGGQLKQGYKSYAIRLEFEDPRQTLEDKQVDKIMQKIISGLDKELNVQIR